MPKITREEGLRIAERAAWETRGRENSGWYTDGARYAKPVVTGLALLVGGAWAWNVVGDAASEVEAPSAPSLPSGSFDLSGGSGMAWFLGFVLLTATIGFFKKAGDFSRFGMVIGGAVALLVGWAVAIGALMAALL